MLLQIYVPVLIAPPFGVVFGTFIDGEDNLKRLLDLQVLSLYFVLEIFFFNIASMLLMETSTASDSKTLF